MSSQLEQVDGFFHRLQDEICSGLEKLDGRSRFTEDVWKGVGGGGKTRVIRDGAVFEQGGVTYSRVAGNDLPASATAVRPDLAGLPWAAAGVSLVIHPWNPYVPTSCANVRYFEAIQADGTPVWWMGGNLDLSPSYSFDEDCLHWHRVARDFCEPFGAEVYPRYKKWCDEYFFIRHRDEERGVGGLFFDDLNEWGFETCFSFIQAVGAGYLQGYEPIVKRRKDTGYGQRERDFQLFRRGRYVEFVLVYDRGTLFGLQSNARADSVLVSLPPRLRFEYAYTPEPGSAEAKAASYFKPTEWI